MSLSNHINHLLVDPSSQKNIIVIIIYNLSCPQMDIHYISTSRIIFEYVIWLNCYCCLFVLCWRDSGVITRVITFDDDQLPFPLIDHTPAFLTCRGHFVWVVRILHMPFSPTPLHFSLHPFSLHLQSQVTPHTDDGSGGRKEWIDKSQHDQENSAFPFGRSCPRWCSWVSGAGAFLVSGVMLHCEKEAFLHTHTHTF